MIHARVGMCEPRSHYGLLHHSCLALREERKKKSRAASFANVTTRVFCYSVLARSGFYLIACTCGSSVCSPPPPPRRTTSFSQRLPPPRRIPPPPGGGRRPSAKNLHARLTSCSDILSSRGGTHRLTLPRRGICTPTHTQTCTHAGGCSGALAGEKTKKKNFLACVRRALATKPTLRWCD